MKEINKNTSVNMTQSVHKLNKITLNSKNMESPKFEFDKLTIIYPTEKIHAKINAKFDSGKNFTIEESVFFWRPTHCIESLNFAGQNGWQIKAVTTKETKDGVKDTYYLQRDDSHLKFGKMTIREEYQASDIYKKHKKQRDDMTKREE